MIVTVAIVPKRQTGSISGREHQDFLFGARFGLGRSGGINAHSFEVLNIKSCPVIVRIIFQLEDRIPINVVIHLHRHHSFSLKKNRYRNNTNSLTPDQVGQHIDVG